MEGLLVSSKIIVYSFISEDVNKTIQLKDMFGKVLQTKNINAQGVAEFMVKGQEAYNIGRDGFDDIEVDMDLGAVKRVPVPSRPIIFNDLLASSIRMAAQDFAMSGNPPSRSGVLSNTTFPNWAKLTASMFSGVVMSIDQAWSNNYTSVTGNSISPITSISYNATTRAISWSGGGIGYSGSHHSGTQWVFRIWAPSWN